MELSKAVCWAKFHFSLTGSWYPTNFQDLTPTMLWDHWLELCLKQYRPSVEWRTLRSLPTLSPPLKPWAKLTRPRPRGTHSRSWARLRSRRWSRGWWTRRWSAPCRVSGLPSPGLEQSRSVPSTWCASSWWGRWRPAPTLPGWPWLRAAAWWPAGPWVRTTRRSTGNSTRQSGREVGVTTAPSSSPSRARLVTSSAGRRNRWWTLSTIT